MFPNTTPPAHTSLATCDFPLPRGECAFLVAERHGGHSRDRRRCPCRSFFPGPAVRSVCGCGHQAWHHEAQPPSDGVSKQEHMRLVDEVARLTTQLQRLEGVEQHVLRRERLWRAIEERLYGNLKLLKLHLDDKIEAMADQTHACTDHLRRMDEKTVLLDDTTMDLENRLDRVELDRGHSSRETTPLASTPRPPPLPLLPQTTKRQLPIRIDKKYARSWAARVIFVLSQSQRFAHDPDSNAYRRCHSRNLQQDLEFSAPDSFCFMSTIETCFQAVLRARPWMPMIAHRSIEDPLQRMVLQTIPREVAARNLWDYPFLEDHCIAHDKMQGDVLYITLQRDVVTWREVRFLPPLISADDACWEHDDELDGSKPNSAVSGTMSDDADPPPYSNRSRLDVLADSALMLQRADTNPPIAVPGEVASLRSLESEETDGEHRVKKPKLRPKQSLPNMHGPGSASTPMYVSGRSKRKMPAREKGLKEPLHWNVGSVARWRPNLLHSHSSKDKEASQDAAPQ